MSKARSYKGFVILKLQKSHKAAACYSAHNSTMTLRASTLREVKEQIDYWVK